MIWVSLIFNIFLVCFIITLCFYNEKEFTNQEYEYIEEVRTLVSVNAVIRERLDELQKDYDNFINTYCYHSVNITAYTTSKDETNHDSGHTATMEKPVVGKTVAVSRDLIHLLGKWVYIEGTGVRYVGDLMNERWEKRIDILVGSKKDAYKFGKKENIKMVVLPNKA